MRQSQGRSFLRGSQHRFGFGFPMERHQGLAAQFPQARDDTLARQVGGRRDQPIGDVQHQARVTTGKGEVGACSPDEPLPDGLHSGIRFKRGSEDRFGLRKVLLKKIRTGKISRDDTDPVPRADFLCQCQRLSELLQCLRQSEQIEIEHT